MKKNELPEWAKKYDRKGVTFRKKGESFALLEVSSERVEGKKHPVLRQKYLGTVTREGFVPARHAPGKVRMLECGLSHFILSNFTRVLTRACFNSSAKFAAPKVAASVVLFLYGQVTPVTVSLTMATKDMEQDVLSAAENSPVVVARLRDRISALLKERIKDERERTDLLAVLRQVQVFEDTPGFPGYPEQAAQIMERNGGKFR